jgi:cytochrome oxidase Cu insertion factor (SCO1/SenC/PrrC family)
VGSGLPHAGGWILLIGEPAGMLAALFIVWGENLRADLRRLARATAGRMSIVALSVAVAMGVFVAAKRVAGATPDDGRDVFALNPVLPPRVSEVPPPLVLLDQRGETTTLARARGSWLVVTFAFGHCETMCPLIVSDVLRARREANAMDVRVFVVTLDPWRDTPERLATLARAWGLGEGDRALSGEPHDVNAVLDAWKVVRRRDPNTGNVDHGSLVVVIDPSGRMVWRLEGAPERLEPALRTR